MENLFNIGDKVDYVNDYGVIFRDKVITEVIEEENGYKYRFTPGQTPWMTTPEKNLHHAGIFKIEDFNLELNNGKIAKFSHSDDNANKIYSIEHKGYSFNVILLNESILYSISDIDFCEPGFPLKEEFQPKVKK